MTEGKWRQIIIESCEKVGTNRREFEPVIDTLAGILAKRDAAEKKFRDEGSQFIISKINTRSGEENPAKNPLMILIMDLNTQALAYWRDLGLTPAGLKKLNGEVTVKKEASLADVLKDLGM